MTSAPTATPRTWELVASPHADAPKGRAVPLRKRVVLLAVARRGLPTILEATVAPAILFFVVMKTAGAGFAMVAVLAWGYGAILRRVVRRQRVPALLYLGTLGLTVRTLVGLVSGSVFAYFLQPIATTVALACVFLGSVAVGRPIVARLAHDFCPLAPEVAGRPAVARLFVGLTLLWAGVHFVTAATTLGMLVSMPVAMFVVLKTIGCLTITIAAVVITVSWALRTARREHLVFAPAYP